MLHRVSKNVPPLSCYNFDTREGILIFFGRNATHKASNQKTSLPCHVKQIVLSALPGKTENTKIAFFIRCISALPELHHMLLDFFNLIFDSRLIVTLLYDSLNRVINVFSLGLLWGMVQENGSRERCGSWSVLYAQSISALSSGFPVSQGNVEALDR